MIRLLLLLAVTLTLAGTAHAHHDRPKAKLRTPLVAGEKPWAATWRNPVNRNLHRIARCWPACSLRLGLR